MFTGPAQSYSPTGSKQTPFFTRIRPVVDASRPPGCGSAAMRRVTRLAIVGALLAGLLGLATGRSPLQPLSAAPGRSLLRGRPTSPLTAITPPRVRLPILDRLLRPTLNQVPGNPSNPSPWGLRFDGVDDRVTFGAAPGLNAAQFTLELWFMREGAGKTASTSGSEPLVTGLPLIPKA